MPLIYLKIRYMWKTRFYDVFFFILFSLDLVFYSIKWIFILRYIQKACLVFDLLCMLRKNKRNQFSFSFIFYIVYKFHMQQQQNRIHRCVHMLRFTFCHQRSLGKLSSPLQTGKVFIF